MKNKKLQKNGSIFLFETRELKNVKKNEKKHSKIK